MTLKIVSSFSARLNEALNGMTLTELALKIGMSKQSLSAYSLGIRNPKQPTIKAISESLNVNPAWICGYDVSKHIDIMPSNIIPITGMAPIYGSIPAGVPVFAEQNIEGYMPIMLKNPQEYFCLRVKGDSMINAHIMSGSVVVIHHQNTAENGEVVACRVNGEETTLKRFKQKDDTVFLMPENSAYEPIIVSYKDFESGNAEILGVAKQTMAEIK